MTTPELPGVGSQQTAPQYQPQVPLAQPGYGPPTQTLPPQPPQAKKQLNVVGLIALIAGVLGFIFACIPGALIVGWILLPVAFVLGLVSLFLKDKGKGMGITALILAVVGTIVGFVVFFAVVASSVDSAFGGGDTVVVQPSKDAGAKGEAVDEKKPASDVGTREKPYPIGSVIENDEWRVVINSVTVNATDAVVAASQVNEAPDAGSQYMMYNYSVTYLGDDPNGQMPAFVSVEYVTADGKTVNGLDKLVIAPEVFDSMSTLYKDATATGNEAVQVPSASADQGVIAITPGMLGDKVFVAVK